MNPGEVVIVKSDDLTGEQQQLMAQAFSQYHRYSLVLLLRERTTLETLPIAEVKRILEQLKQATGVKGRAKSLIDRLKGKSRTS